MQYIYIFIDQKSQNVNMSKISGAVHLMLPSQLPGVHAKRALNVLVASQQTQHNEPTLASRQRWLRIG